MSRFVLATGVSLIALSYGMTAAAFSDEQEESPAAETPPGGNPGVRRTIVVPTRTVPARTQYRAVTVPVHITAEEVANQIQMELVVAELRGDVARALKEAGFHEIPGGNRYRSGEVKDLAKQLESMKACAEVDVLSRPQIRSLLGQPTHLQVGCEPNQIAYLIPTGKKTFEARETVPQPALGLTIRLTAQAVAEDPARIEISPLSISTTTLDGREPIPGIDLDVGKPIISTRKLETSIQLTAGETSGIVLPGPSGRKAILFLNLHRVSAEVRPTPTKVTPIVEPASSPAVGQKPNQK